MSQVVCERCFHLNKHCTCHPPAQSDSHSYDARLEAQLAAQQETQPAPDVIDRMWIALCDRPMVTDRKRERMTAAAQVLLDEALGPVTEDEWQKEWLQKAPGPSFRDAIGNILANRRARLAAKPPQHDTREQQVTSILQAAVKETNEQWESAAKKVAKIRTEIGERK